MRGIKFRAFDTYTNRIVSWEEIKESCEFDSFFDLVSFEKMQFTGLKDCNGADIFEGDIVEIPECNHLKFVEWCSESCCFVLRHLPNNRYSENFYFEEFSKIKVIGNIYQNHELPEQCK